MQVSQSEVEFTNESIDAVAQILEPWIGRSSTLEIMTAYKIFAIRKMGARIDEATDLTDSSTIDIMDDTFFVYDEKARRNILSQQIRANLELMAGLVIKACDNFNDYLNVLRMPDTSPQLSDWFAAGDGLQAIIDDELSSMTLPRIAGYRVSKLRHLWTPWGMTVSSDPDPVPQLLSKKPHLVGFEVAARELLILDQCHRLLDTAYTLSGYSLLAELNVLNSVALREFD